MTENIRYLNRINQLSEDDMRDYITLHRLLEIEMKKSPEDMDLDLIDECFAQIDELVGEGPTRSPVAVQAKIKEILGTPTNKASHIGKKSRPIAAADTKNRHRVRNFFIILAASLVLLYSSLAVAAKVQGYDNTWEFITRKVIEIFDLDAGEILEEDNITLIVENERIIYHSVDALLNAENLDVLYPSYIPEGNPLVSTRKYAQNNQIKYVFTFKHEVLSITIKNYYSYDSSSIIDFQEYDMGLYQFYVKDLNNGTYQALCQLKGYEYAIIHDNHEELLKMIESTKGRTS